MEIKITESTKFDEPTLKQKHPLEGSTGTQIIWRFKNDYGASVVQFKINGNWGSYTSDESEWELAVIKFDKEGNYALCYETPITDDVIGHLKKEEVEEILKKIKNLKKR